MSKKKLADFKSKINPLMSEMERNFTRYMTKLGAHVIHLAVHGAENTAKGVKRGCKFLLDKTAPRRSVISASIHKQQDKILGKISGIRTSYTDFRNDLKTARTENGVFSAWKLFNVTAGKRIWSYRGGVVKVFNWVAPVVSIMFLVNVVSYASALDYGISVECNGQKLGIITEEGVYDDAERAMQERITYVEGQETVTISPRFSVQMVRNSEEIINPNQLVDKMIINSDAELSEAYGLYIDDKFVGALTEPDKQSVMRTLASILEKYNSPDVKTIDFEKNVEYREGLYLTSSFVSASTINKQLNQKTQTEVTYTIESGDTPIMIAAKNNITLSELKELNPNIEKSCVVGKTVLLSREIPYMSVRVTKDMEYDEVVDYETVKIDNNNNYKGVTETIVKGEEGEAHVKAEVEYVNGYEVGRTVKSRTITKQPVTEKLSVGTRNPKPATGTVISGNGIYCWPVAGGRISSYMGDGRGHKGIDIAAPKGTSIFAADDGVVIMSKWYSGYGNCIMIQHPDGNITLYGHQSKLIAKYGQTVERGEVIGLVGNTGNSFGNHLHFEVRSNGKFHNPLQYVK